KSPEAQTGIFSSHVLVVQPFAIGLDKSPKSWDVVNLTFGTALGFGYFNLQTKTSALNVAPLNIPTPSNCPPVFLVQNK
ncbi:MAG TPA: hypothetical protein PLA68_15380, partial [Panacibacter sp.]|nr:hypothetical protein [Panacibacter sp.]